MFLTKHTLILDGCHDSVCCLKHVITVYLSLFPHSHFMYNSLASINEYGKQLFPSSVSDLLQHFFTVVKYLHGTYSQKEEIKQFCVGIICTMEMLRTLEFVEQSEGVTLPPSHFYPNRRSSRQQQTQHSQLHRVGYKHTHTHTHTHTHEPCNLRTVVLLRYGLGGCKTLTHVDENPQRFQDNMYTQSSTNPSYFLENCT